VGSWLKRLIFKWKAIAADAAFTGAKDFAPLTNDLRYIADVRFRKVYLKHLLPLLVLKL
jgi:hypothetical protein